METAPNVVAYTIIKRLIDADWEAIEKYTHMTVSHEGHVEMIFRSPEGDDPERFAVQVGKVIRWWPEVERFAYGATTQEHAIVTFRWNEWAV